VDADLKKLPQDRASLEAIVRSLLLEQEHQKQRAEAEILRQKKRGDELHLENLRLQLELQRLKKWRYGPRADRLTNAD
jgi:hypothetical protein